MSSPGEPPEDGAAAASPPEAAAPAAAAALPPPPAAPPPAEEGEADAIDEWVSGEEDEDVDEDEQDEFEDWLDHDMEDEEWEAMGEMEEDEDMDEEMEDMLSDSGSSDEEGAEGAEARVAAETSGWHVHTGFAAYAIPTVSHHFQSADALSVVQLPASAGGGLLAATFDSEGLAAWRLPAAGSVEKLGVASEPAMHRLGGFQAPRDIYSMALSPCGRWIATGGEGGLLCLYSLDPSAPPRRPTAGRKPQLQGLNYLFTPQQRLGFLAQAVANAPHAMQTLVASAMQGGAALQGPAAALAGFGAAQLPPQQQKLLQQVLSAVISNTLHGDFHDLAVESAQSAVQEQLRRLQEESTRLAAEAAALRRLPAAGPHERAAQEQQLAELERQLADIAERQGFAEQRLEMFARRLHSQSVRNSAAVAAEKGSLPGQPQEAAERGDQPAAACKGKEPAAAAAEEQQQQGQQAQQAQQAQQGGGAALAALVLRGIFSLGLEPHQVQRVPFLSDGMTNGVRWGTVAGQLRLLAADQSQYVFIFERPSLDPSPAADAASSSRGGTAGISCNKGELQPQQMLCSGLGDASPHWCMRPVNFFRTQQHALGARVSQQFPPPDAAADAAQQPPADAAGAAAQAAQDAPPVLVRSQRAAAAAASAAWAPLAKAAAGRTDCRSGSPYMTAALGPFPVPCNLAAASPDGRWVAVAGDSQCVFLCDQADGFAWRPLPYDLAGPRDNVEADVEAGSQYLAWNASSTLLAVTSDALHAVFVFEPRSGRLVLRVEGHRGPCLCVAFAPWDDRLLVYGEDSKRVHLRRVPHEHEAAAGGSSASGGGGGEEEGQLGAGQPPAAALFEQNAQDDLADARPGYQLLRVPILPQVPAAQMAVGASVRRRRVNGMALSPDGDLLLATKQGRVLRYLSSQPWAVQRHAAWPPAFRAAARTLLCSAHRQPPAGAGVGLWSLPLPLLQHIVELLAGSRLDWLGEEAPPAGGQQGVAADAAGGSGTEEAAGGSGSEVQPHVVSGGGGADFMG